MNTQEPTPAEYQKNAMALIEELAESLAVLAKAGRHLMMVPLSFTTIDVASSLTREDPETDARGRHFKNWVTEYMVPYCGFGCSADDLYAARCGAIHTFGPFSNLWKENQNSIRLFQYANTPEGVADLQKWITDRGKRNIAISPQQLAYQVLDAVRKFMKDVSTNPELQKRFAANSTKVFFVRPGEKATPVI